MTVTIIIYLSYFVTQKLYLEKLYYERKRWLYEKQTWCNMIQWIQNKNGNYFCELPKGDYIGRDLVTVDELERLWTTHRTLDTRVVLSLLTAMGTGKTQFIINNIVQLALKQNLRVLVLSPRQSLREQLTGDYLRSVGLSKPSMKFMCYQSLREQLYTIDGQRELENYYDIVIFDEVHLLFSDREFIEYNNSIYEWLLHTRQFTVSLSATYEVAKTILVDRIENAMKYTITQEIDFQGLPFVFGSEYDAIDYLENAEEDIPTFLCVEKLFSHGEPKPLVKHCLDNIERLHTTSRVSSGYFSNKKEDDYNKEYFNKLKKLQAKSLDKTLPSMTYLTSGVCNSGVEFYKYTDENGETHDIDKVRIVVNFTSFIDSLQSVNRVRILNNAEVFVVCPQWKSVTSKINNIRNTFNDKLTGSNVLEFIEELVEDGTTTKFDTWRQNHDNLQYLPKGLYRDTNGTIQMDMCELGHYYNKLCELEYVVEKGEQYKKFMEERINKGNNGQPKKYNFKNDTMPYYLAYSEHLAQYCNCNRSQFTRYKRQGEIVDDEVEVDNYLTDLYTDENALPYHTRDGKFVGIFIAFTDEEKFQFCKNIGAITDRKKNTKSPKLVNETLKEYALDDKWEVRNIQRKNNGRVFVLLRKDTNESL